MEIVGSDEEQDADSVVNVSFEVNRSGSRQARINASCRGRVDWRSLCGQRARSGRQGVVLAKSTQAMGEKRARRVPGRIVLARIAGGKRADEDYIGSWRKAGRKPSGQSA